MANYIRKNKRKPEKQRTYHRELHQSIDNEYFAAMAALEGVDRVTVYVEGYEDIAFWRNIFDEFATPKRKFQIMTPVRPDLAKGKKVVLGFAERSGPNLLLCVDSDFDYLFQNANAQSVKVNSCQYLIQTYTYAIENLQCYPSSLQTIAVKASKTDLEIFDFERFFREYSTVIYPAFVWYAYAAYESNPEVFSLSDFRNTVKINYLDVADNGSSTIAFVDRQVQRRVSVLSSRYIAASEGIEAIERMLRERGVEPSQTHFYMQGHTLLDNVVKVVLSSVCEGLRRMMLQMLDRSRADALSQRNQISYYNNSLVDIDQLLSDNRGYMKSPFYEKIKARIGLILGDIPSDGVGS